MQTGDKSSNCPRCLICDVDIGEDDDGYDILCNGSSLYQLVNNILRLDLDAIVARSTLLCKNCFELLAELEGAENRCAEIRNTFRLSFSKTCQLNGDDYAPFVVAGIACQTDSKEISTNRNEEKQDLKMKITLVSKRKRGRPSKPLTRSKKRCDSPASEDPFRDDDKTTQTIKNGGAAVVKSGKKIRERSSKQDNTKEIARLETLILEARRTRSTARGNARKKTVEIEMMKEESPEQPPIETVELNCNDDGVTDEPKIENSMSLNADEVFVEEFNGNDTTAGGDDEDDDDFEWKEESTADSEDDSANSADEFKGKENNKNDDDSHSTDSKEGKKKGRKKKRKRGDRKGERAFMVPVHECQQCGKKWRTVTELKSHVASHSDVRPFVCEICGQAYKMKKALDIHIGMHNGIHPFVCSYCNKSFTQKVGLEKHLPIHTGVTRFQCDLCGKRFIHQKSFNIHKMTHTGEKNIHCPICKLAVFSQSHLKRHYRVHTGERPYGCTICGKKFAEKYNLNAHAKIHDPNSAGEGRRRCHTCPICGITYDRKHKMADHLSTAHCMWQQQSSTIEFKQEDFYNVDLPQPQTQHHMLPLQAQHSAAIQPTQSQQPQPAQLSQQQSFAPPRLQQQQTQQSVTTQSSQPTQQQQQQQQQQPTQMVAHPAQHHLHTVTTHHQQQSTQLSSHPLQTHHAQATGAAPHHLLVTQHQLQQSLQTHSVHHSLTPPPPSLQPISSVFQVVLQPPSALDTVSSTTVHHNHNRSHMNAVPTLMTVPTP